MTGKSNVTGCGDREGPERRVKMMRRESGEIKARIIQTGAWEVGGFQMVSVAGEPLYRSCTVPVTTFRSLVQYP